GAGIGTWVEGLAGWASAQAEQAFRPLGMGGPTASGSSWSRRSCSVTPPESPMDGNRNPQQRKGRFAYEGLDRVIHERARLSVLTSLVARPRGLRFGDLKELCRLTDGNLSRHLQVLQEARLVEISKGFEANRPQTRCRITAQGRRRYLEY